MGFISISYAIDNSPMPLPAKIFRVSRDKADIYICPEGYALTSINPSAHETIEVMIESECDDKSCVLDRARSLCDDDPRYDFPISNTPNMTYTCQKIKNHWAGTLITGKRG